MLNSLKMEKSGSKCLVLFKRIKYFPINYEQIGDLTVKINRPLPYRASEVRSVGLNENSIKFL